MQPSPQVNDYMIFKDEILKKIRLLENKFTSDFNSNFNQINIGFEQLENKINILTQNNNSLLELITKQNFNYEKFTEFDNFKVKVEHELLSHEIKIKNILQDLDKLKIRYDKILNENLIVPGMVGPGGVYKNMADYLQYQMNEFQKVRNDTEQTKNKVDNFRSNALKVVNNSFVQFQNYTDDKSKDTQIKIERKYNQFNEKILELETEINKYQYKIEKQIKPMQIDIQKLIKLKNDPLYTHEKQFEDINQKINLLIEELEIIKLNNKDLDSKISYYKQTNNSSDFLNSKNNSKYKVINNNISCNELFNNSKSFTNIKKINKKSSKNALFFFENEQKNINNKELPKLNKDIMSLHKSNFSKENEKELKNEKNERSEKSEKIEKKIEKSEKNEKNDKIEKNEDDNNKDNILEEQNYELEDKSEKQINANYNYNLNKSEDLSLSKEDLNKNEKNNENENENIDENPINNNDLLGNDKFAKISNDKIRRKSKIKYVDKGTEANFLAQLKEQPKKYNNERIINKKIGFDGLYKQKNYTQSDNLININYKNKKEEDKFRQFNLLKPINKNKIISLDKFEDKKISSNSMGKNTENNIVQNINKKMNNNINNNMNNDINNNINNTITPNNNSRLNNINKKINNMNIFSKTSNHSFLDKKEKIITKDYNSSKKKHFDLNMNMNTTLEQKQIMKKIRDYYKNKKIVMAKKLHQNVVDCNIINLNMKDPSDIINITYKNSSAKTSLYSLSKSSINEKRNKLREISMKLSPHFERTSYGLFSRKDKINNLKNYSSFD